MSDQVTFVVALTGLVTALIGGFVAWRKLKPETANIVVTTAERATEMTLKFASQVGLENDQLQRDINELRAEFVTYRRDTDAHLAELGAQLRAEKAEKEHFKAEAERLGSRVTELEAEVARLKADR